MEPIDPRECQLYLVSPPELDAAAFVPVLTDALKAGPQTVAAFELHLPNASDAELIQLAETFLPICHEHGVAFLLADRGDLAEQVGADGVHLRHKAKAAKGLRAHMGEEFIIGVSCNNSNHAAMQAGEDGANFVVFNEIHRLTELDVLQWWQQFFVLPCVAEGAFTAAECDVYIQAGGDMLSVSDVVWDCPQGAGAAVTAFAAAMTQALQSV